MKHITKNEKIAKLQNKNKKFRALKKRLIKKSQRNLAKIAKLNSQNVR